MAWGPGNACQPGAGKGSSGGPGVKKQQASDPALPARAEVTCYNMDGGSEASKCIFTYEGIMRVKYLEEIKYVQMLHEQAIRHEHAPTKARMSYRMCSDNPQATGAMQWRQKVPYELGHSMKNYPLGMPTVLGREVAWASEKLVDFCLQGLIPEVLSVLTGEELNGQGCGLSHWDLYNKGAAFKDFVYGAVIRYPGVWHRSKAGLEFNRLGIADRMSVEDGMPRIFPINVFDMWQQTDLLTMMFDSWRGSFSQADSRVPMHIMFLEKDVPLVPIFETFNGFWTGIGKNPSFSV